VLSLKRSRQLIGEPFTMHASYFVVELSPVNKLSLAAARFRSPAMVRHALSSVSLTGKKDTLLFGALSYEQKAL